MTTEQELDAKKARIESIEHRIKEMAEGFEGGMERLEALAEVFNEFYSNEPFERMKECEFFYVASINGRTRTELHRCKTCHALTDDTEAHARFHFHHRCLHTVENGMSMLTDQRLQVSAGYVSLALEELMNTLAPEDT